LDLQAPEKLVQRTWMNRCRGLKKKKKEISRYQGGINAGEGTTRRGTYSTAKEEEKSGRAEILIPLSTRGKKLTTLKLRAGGDRDVRERQSKITGPQKKTDEETRPKCAESHRPPFPLCKSVERRQMNSEPSGLPRTQVKTQRCPHGHGTGGAVMLGGNCKKQTGLSPRVGSQQTHATVLPVHNPWSEQLRGKR